MERIMKLNKILLELAYSDVELELKFPIGHYSLVIIAKKPKGDGTFNLVDAVRINITELRIAETDRITIELEKMIMRLKDNHHI